jgi:signal peptidase I
MPPAPESSALSRTVAAGFCAGLVSLVVLRLWIVGIYSIPTPSMAPGLVAGDAVLVARLAYRNHPPMRGDVVVFQRRGDDSASVKRVIGLPGDRIELRDSVVFANGRALVRTRMEDLSLDASGMPVRRPVELPERTRYEESDGSRAWTIVQFRESHPQSGVWVVPPGTIFVLGDNRDASRDSREATAAPVRLEDVIGRVERVVFSRGSQGFRSRWWLPVR